jgi:hypothetical protein
MEPRLVDLACLTAYLLVPGVIGYWWIRMRLGFDKRWFVIPAAPLISRNIYYVLPTFIVAATLTLANVVIVGLNPNGPVILPLVVMGFLALGFVFAYFEPAWLSPVWYVWLKKELGVLLPFFAREAHELGRQEWLRRSATQEGLEEWVRDFKRRFPY